MQALPCPVHDRHALPGWQGLDVVEVVQVLNMGSGELDCRMHWPCELAELRGTHE
jgi:hypothetical protein